MECGSSEGSGELEVPNGVVNMFYVLCLILSQRIVLFLTYHGESPAILRIILWNACIVCRVLYGAGILSDRPNVYQVNKSFKMGLCL